MQPLFAELAVGGFAVAHNGNLTNGLTLRRELIAQGRDLPVDLRHRSHPASRRPLASAAASSSASSMRCASIEGAYALVGLTNKKLIGARDPLGIRPLVLGELDGAYILRSETCALDIIGAKFVREIENGEVVVISRRQASRATAPSRAQPARPCIFEYIYFSRPDSMLGGRSVYDVRKQHGHAACAEKPAPKPMWSCRCRIPACRRHMGFAPASGIPFELGIIRNHYVGRTFIEPTQTHPRAGREAEAQCQSRSLRASASCWSTTRSCAAPPRSRSCR